MTPEQIQRIADRLAPAMRRAFIEAVQALRAQINVGDLADALEAAGGIQQILAELALTPEELKPIRDLVNEIASKAASTAAAEYGMSFNLVNPFAVRWADEHSSQLIRELTDETRRAVQQVITAGQVEGVNVREQAKMLREIVGLTQRDAGAANRIWQGALERGETFAARALERASSRFLRARAENIARTETIHASNMGVELATQTAIDRNLLPPGTQKVWIVTHDDRLCPLCAPMDGQIVAVGERFTSDAVGNNPAIPTTVRTPPLHPSCRCAIGVEFTEPTTPAVEPPAAAPEPRPAAPSERVQVTPPSRRPTWEELGVKLPRDPARRKLLEDALEHMLDTLPESRHAIFTQAIEAIPTVRISTATASTKSVRTLGKVTARITSGKPQIKDMMLQLSRQSDEWNDWVRAHNSEFRTIQRDPTRTFDEMNAWKAANPEPVRWRLASTEELSDVMLHEVSHALDFLTAQPGKTYGLSGGLYNAPEVSEAIKRGIVAGDRSFSYALESKAEEFAELVRMRYQGNMTPAAGSGVESGMTAAEFANAYPEIVRWVDETLDTVTVTRRANP